MKVYLIQHGELLEFDTLTIHIEVTSYGSNYDRFVPQEEPKWVEFCRKHKFSPTRDYGSKVYRMYLEMCAEGLI